MPPKKKEEVKEKPLLGRFKSNLKESDGRLPAAPGGAWRARQISTAMPCHMLPLCAQRCPPALTPVMTRA